ncbi:MAG: diguanylate cyclase [Spirochaetia bacterium]|nr:diguanylate cyclase [Spirochaetia bacterium]
MNVLVVDHSKMLREIIRSEVEPLGFTVMSASNSQEVYDILSKDKIDLITLSVELREESGYDICKKIRNDHNNGNGMESFPHIPIIFITGHDTMEGRARGFESGATEFIAKPFKKGYVGERIKKLIQPEIMPLRGLTAVVVDDSLTARKIVAEFLESRGVKVIEAKDGLEGFSLIKENLKSVDIVITDMMMPNLKGDELCVKVRNELQNPDLPILVLSGAGEHFSILDIFRAGATDYLNKPFIQEELLARISVHLQTRILKRKLQTKIKQLKDINETLEQMACTDSLTQLHNRKYLFDRLKELNNKKERYGYQFAFLIVDIDYFKKINDSFGHQMGDCIIKELGSVIQTKTRDSDIVARLGGEEYAVVVTDQDESGCKSMAENIRSSIEEHEFCKNEDSELKHVTVSMGMYLSRQKDGLSIEEIYKKADECLYNAKEGGRNRVFFGASPE